MKPERWQRIEQLFHAALDREPSERAAFLDYECAGDESMRREIESLLASASRMNARSARRTSRADLLQEEQIQRAVGRHDRAV